MTAQYKDLEIGSIYLSPNDVLLIKVKGEDFDHSETIDSLKAMFKELFPDNKVVVFSMNTTHDISFDIIKQGAVI